MLAPTPKTRSPAGAVSRPDSFGTVRPPAHGEGRRFRGTALAERLLLWLLMRVLFRCLQLESQVLGPPMKDRRKELIAASIEYDKRLSEGRVQFSDAIQLDR